MIQSIPILGFETDLEQRRGLVGLIEKILNGALRGIFDFTLFGLVILIATFFATYTLMLRSHSSDFGIKVMCSIQLGFVFVEIVSALLGYNMLIKNVRYYESIIPISILLLNQGYLSKGNKSEL